MSDLLHASLVHPDGEDAHVAAGDGVVGAVPEHFAVNALGQLAHGALLGLVQGQFADGLNEPATRSQPE